jgi:hypothetical protein
VGFRPLRRPNLFHDLDQIGGLVIREKWPLTNKMKRGYELGGRFALLPSDVDVGGEHL